MRLWRLGSGRIGRLALVKLAVAIGGAASALVVARALTASGQGTYETAMVMALLLVPLAQMSGRVGLVAELAADDRDPTAGLGQLALLQALAASGSVGLGVVLLLSEPPVAGLGLALATLVILPAASVASFTHAVWWSEGRSLAPELLVLFETILRLVGVGSVASIGRATPASIVAVSVGSRAAAAVVGLVLVRATLARVTLRHPRRSLARLAKGCGLATLTALALKALFRLDIMMLDGFGLEVDDIGRYGVGVRLLELVWVAPLAVSQTRFLDGARQRRAPDGGQPVVDRSLVLGVVGLAAAAGTAAVVGSAWQAEAMLGPSYQGMWSMMLLAAPGIVGFSAVPLLRNELLLERRFTRMLGRVGSALAINVVGNAVFIPLWGAHGAAVGTSVAYVSLAIFLWGDVVRWRPSVVAEPPLGRATR